jgi:nucleoside-diphosphate-sugar epimerase
MTTVLINGAHSPLGRRLAALVGGDPDVTTVLATEAKDRLVTADGPVDVVILAAAAGPDRDGSTVGGVDLETVADLLAALHDAISHQVEVRRLVVLSSAMVYGAWPDNAVPLSESAALRPNPGCRYASRKAELERLCVEWAIDHQVPAAVLRPTITVSDEPEAVDWMEASLWHAPTARHGEGDPPGQFLLVEDLAAALEHARRVGIEGTFNVAPDGWIGPDRQVDLTGRGGRLRIPSPVAGLVAAIRWRWRLTSTPPEIVPYTMHPWVVANDRLRATGWEPTATNDEAFVAGNREGWWSSLNARRRQDIALGALVAGIGGLTGGVVGALRRSRRRA